MNRGRKLLAQGLREFAVAEGYVRPSDGKPESKTIDLEKYRAARAGKPQP